MRRASVPERLLRRALRLLLPAPFRDDWGEEIVLTARARARDARREGGPTLIAFVARELVALVVLVVAARRRSAVTDPRRLPMLTDPEDTRRYRVAWAVAIAVHFAAFVIVFPFGGGRLEAAPEQELTVVRIFHPPKPPEPVKTEVVKRRSSPVPIPDPTPEEPEPIVSEAEVLYVEPVEAADVEYVVAPPPGPPTGAAEQQLFRVGPDVQRPEQLVRVQPEYPELARRARLECAVILEARLGVEGDVRDVQVLRGCGLGLDEAAVRAVSQWRYAPTTVNGRPVEVAMTVTVVFRLRS